MTVRIPLGIISGIDVAEGLCYCLNDHAFYWAQLQSFRDQFQNAAAELTERMRNGAWPEALLLAHSIKGTSAILGMTGLCDAAARLEDVLKRYAARDDRAPDPPELEQVRLELEKMKTGMQVLASLMETHEA